MVTSNMQHARFIEEWEYFTWRILLMILSLPLSLSLCGCRFVLRFRRETEERGSILLHINSKTNEEGWSMGWGGVVVG